MTNITDRIRKEIVADAWETGDVTPPKQLELERARYGYFREYPKGPNLAFLLQLNDVEPGCKLQILNLSTNPEAKWGKDEQELPFDTLQPMASGRYTAVLSKSAAEKLGINPGDVFELRQVDAAGHASAAIQVALNQRDAVDPGTLSRADFVFWDGIDEFPAIPGPMKFAPAKDATPPVVLPTNMAFHFFDGSATLTADHALEPGARLNLENLRTGRSWSSVVREDRKLSVAFQAAIGDPIHIFVTDPNDNKVDFGTTRFAPIMRAMDARISPDEDPKK